MSRLERKVYLLIIQNMHCGIVTLASSHQYLLCPTGSTFQGYLTHVNQPVSCTQIKFLVLRILVLILICQWSIEEVLDHRLEFLFIIRFINLIIQSPPPSQIIIPPFKPPALPHLISIEFTPPSHIISMLYHKERILYNKRLNLWNMDFYRS